MIKTTITFLAIALLIAVCGGIWATAHAVKTFKELF
jgi:hypothetical protein